LFSGTRLGPYEILAPIGAGGMGEVYKARDTRLDRLVAVKVESEQFSARFEARAVASLNYPISVSSTISGRTTWSWSWSKALRSKDRCPWKIP
jgi:serine/threonine protein kinase